MAGVKISGLPTLSSSALTDIFPTVQSGVTYKTTLNQILENITTQYACRLATTVALTATYSNGTAGVGATLTNSGALAALTVDSVATVVGDRILVKDQAATLQNGVYTVTTIGSGAVAWVLTRTTDFDTTGEIDAGDSFTVAFGTINAKTQWIETAVITAIGTDPVTFESNVVAGAGILKTNNSLSVTGGGLPWTEITSATQAISVNNGYISNRGGGVAFSLPVTSSVGNVFSVVGKAGAWSITQGAGQQINVGATSTTVGAGGSLTSAAATDSAQFICITANTIWQVIGGPQTAGFVLA